MVRMRCSDIVFLDNDYNIDAYGDGVLVPHNWFEKFIDKFHEDSMIVRITNQETKESRVVSVFGPQYEQFHTVFIPSWIMDTLGVSNNDDILIDIVNDTLPVAAYAEFNIIYPTFTNKDISYLRDLFEQKLDNFHIIEKNKIIKIPVYDSPEYNEIICSVQNISPEELCRVRGEIAVDFTGLCEEKMDKITNKVEEDVAEEDVLQKVAKEVAEKITINNIETTSMIPIKKDEEGTKVIEKVDDVDLVIRRETVRSAWATRFQNK